ncbi:MAG: hypothetical protein QOH50_3894 [Kribbellaceae bacterium]|jgi:hypothetical protein|nr:hypothetical protein [Kribbellaceae bacterium]
MTKMLTLISSPDRATERGERRGAPSARHQLAGDNGPHVGDGVPDPEAAAPV